MSHINKVAFKSFITGLRYLVVKTYILVILFDYNHLCKIYYTFKKEFRYAVVVKKEKNVIDDNCEIYIYSNMGTLDLQGNQWL